MSPPEPANVQPLFGGSSHGTSVPPPALKFVPRSQRGGREEKGDSAAKKRGKEGSVESHAQEAYNDSDSGGEVLFQSAVPRAKARGRGEKRGFAENSGEKVGNAVPNEANDASESEDEDEIIYRQVLIGHKDREGSDRLAERGHTLTQVDPTWLIPFYIGINVDVKEASVEGTRYFELPAGMPAWRPAAASDAEPRRSHLNEWQERVYKCAIENQRADSDTLRGIIFRLVQTNKALSVDDVRYVCKLLDRLNLDGSFDSVVQSHIKLSQLLKNMPSPSNETPSPSNETLSWRRMLTVSVCLVESLVDGGRDGDAQCLLGLIINGLVLYHLADFPDSPSLLTYLSQSASSLVFIDALLSHLLSIFGDILFTPLPSPSPSLLPSPSATFESVRDYEVTSHRHVWASGDAMQGGEPQGETSPEMVAKFAVILKGLLEAKDTETPQRDRETAQGDRETARQEVGVRLYYLLDKLHGNKVCTPWVRDAVRVLWILVFRQDPKWTSLALRYLAVTQEECQSILRDIFLASSHRQGNGDMETRDGDMETRDGDMQTGEGDMDTGDGDGDMETGDSLVSDVCEYLYKSGKPKAARKLMRTLGVGSLNQGVKVNILEWEVEPAALPLTGASSTRQAGSRSTGQAGSRSTGQAGSPLSELVLSLCNTGSDLKLFGRLFEELERETTWLDRAQRAASIVTRSSYRRLPPVLIDKLMTLCQQEQGGSEEKGSVLTRFWQEGGRARVVGQIASLCDDIADLSASNQLQAMFCHLVEGTKITEIMYMRGTTDMRQTGRQRRSLVTLLRDLLRRAKTTRRIECVRAVLEFTKVLAIPELARNCCTDLIEWFMSYRSQLDANSARNVCELTEFLVEHLQTHAATHRETVNLTKLMQRVAHTYTRHYRVVLGVLGVIGALRKSCSNTSDLKSKLESVGIDIMATSVEIGVHFRTDVEMLLV